MERFIIFILLFCFSLHAECNTEDLKQTNSEDNSSSIIQLEVFKLSENDKLKIKQEEIFRDEIRKEIKKSSKQKEIFSVWVFVNTSFGIWLLSTVVVGFFAHVTLIFRDKKAEKQRNKTKQEEIDLQLSFRLKHLNMSLEQSSQHSEYKHYSIQIGFFLNGIAYTNISHNLKDRTTISLLLELGKIVDSAEEKNEIQNAINASMALYDMKTEGHGDRVEKNMDENRKRELVRNYKTQIKSLQLKRWEFSVNN